LILGIVSVQSTSFFNVLNSGKTRLDNQPVLYTPSPTQAQQAQNKPQISKVDSESHDSSTESHESISHDPKIKVSDINSNQELKGINWGSIAIGQTKDYSIQVTNIGDQPVTLGLSATNWTPGIDAKIAWQYNGAAIAAGSTIKITINLIVNSATSNTFGNDIVISATNVNM
jgi:hypothetical protein